MASQDWFEKDFYAILGVKKDVSDAELKKVYRKLARQHHPDSNPGDAKAEAKFKEIGEAYAVLSDPQERAEYDQVRAMGAGGARFTTGGQGGFEDVFGGIFNSGARQGRRSGARQAEFEDILGGIFGQGGFGQGGFGTSTGGFRGASGPTKGEDVTGHVTIDFLDAVHGTAVSVKGAGGKMHKAKVPAGVNDGQKLRVRGAGWPSFDGGATGDLVITVAVRRHPVFTRDGLNLRVDVPITFVEAVQGATIEVPTLEGETVRLRVAPGTPSGRVLRVKGRGVTSSKGTGDLLATVQVAVPGHLPDQAREAFEAFAKAMPDENPRDDLLTRAKGA